MYFYLHNHYWTSNLITLSLLLYFFQALASTRVVIVPTADGPNDSAVMDAQTSQLREKKFSGSGSDTDIITSSARAYVSAINKLLTWKVRRMANGVDETGSNNAVPLEGEAPHVVAN